jgi:hypothetical protein
MPRSGKKPVPVRDKRDKAGPGQDKAGPGPVVPSPDLAAALDRDLAADGPGPTADGPGSEAWDILLRLAADPDMPAAARASAARTLAEMQGSIGRHAPPPPRHDVDVAQLSRAELVQELERLRALVPVNPG